MHPKIWKLFFISFIIFLSPNLAFSQGIPQGIKVVTTIKPIHSIISSLTQNISIPEFIVDGFTSEHGYILRPTDIQKLSEANMVVWVGETVDPFIMSYIKQAPKNQLIINLHNIPGINLLKIRSGGVWEAHEHHDCTENIHEDDHDEENPFEEHVHDHNCSDITEIYDGHIWLDPDNAKTIAIYLAEELTKLDPLNKAVYSKNLTMFLQQTTSVAISIKNQLAPYKKTPLLVGHDAYQYYERYFQLNIIGSITIVPEEIISAKRLKEIQQKIARYPHVCVFQEPQHTNPKWLQVLSTTNNISLGTLDPIGAEIHAGPGLYFELLQKIALSIIECSPSNH